MTWGWDGAHRSGAGDGWHRMPHHSHSPDTQTGSATSHQPLTSHSYSPFKYHPCHPLVTHTPLTTPPNTHAGSAANSTIHHKITLSHMQTPLTTAPNT